MRTSVDVHNFLQAMEVEHEIVLLEGSSRSARHAAALCGLSPDEIAETHVFDADGSPVVVLAPGGTPVSEAALARAIGARECRKLRNGDVMRLTDYPTGAVPPLALKTPMPLVVDDAFRNVHCIYASAGEHGAILKIRLSDLLEANGDGHLARVTGRLARVAQ